MLDQTTREEIAQELYDCYRQHRQITLLTKSHPEIEAEDSYRIQELIVEKFKAAGSRVNGYKIGLTSKPMQEMAGTTEPDYSVLLDEMFVPEASVLSMQDYIAPMVEIELAFVMKERLSGPSVTVADVIRAVDFALPAIEIVDLRVAMAPGMDVRDTIADLAAVGGVVLGGNPIDLKAVDIRKVHGQLIIDGEVKQEGFSDAVLGNPLNAVAWLANKLSDFGTAFEPGDVILSGSFIRVEPVSTNQQVIARFSDGFGDVTFSMA